VSLLVKILYVALGGALGSVLRYLLDGAVQRLAGTGFPTGIVVINAIGCLAIGFLSTILTPSLVPEQYRIGVLTGILGGFTTFSTYSLDTLQLARQGQLALAGLNVVLQNVLGLVGAWGGWQIARAFFKV
jgi:CrcB protein